MSAADTSSVTNGFFIAIGLLTMHLDESTFQKTGLSGQSINIGHQTVWRISISLESSQTFYEKANERLMRACETILSRSLNWMVCEISGSGLASDTLKNFDSRLKKRTVLPNISQSIVASPDPVLADIKTWSSTKQQDHEQKALDLYEWLSLVSLESALVKTGNVTDSFLSRYQHNSRDADQDQIKVCVISWSGLIGSTWFHNLVRDGLMMRRGRSWILINATRCNSLATGGSLELKLLRPCMQEDQYLMWHIRSAP
ncbi:uncharacterized protein UV8b_07421 [Ustilaginoidea virens]|uniref:Uncharacterized protein n=1 Tax=Ustilaginoidea virens TaxID=1159556 RepID=A0A8E5HX12_USTVR|nr:uncharacterized protein UV8b_07421 [Ustilaginoidea virens]QUC23180.1 hypothetical protein UV8b_07421 [Ustilaginoidea virens]